MDMTRSAGILLHPSSLPGRGIGELGEAAFAFVDWIADAGQTLWQILPLVPTASGSPYNGLAAAGGNPMLVSLEALVRDGLLPASEVEAHAVGGEPVDFHALARWKGALLARAHRAFRGGAAPQLAGEFADFRERGAGWLPELSLFLALREHFGDRPWTQWDDDIRAREPAALEHWRQRLEEEVERHAFAQFLFARQWAALREHANARGVRIIGDIPIFVSHDSADVWAHPEIFQLDDAGLPTVVSGVPPDYFSETGQRWGNPLYNWEALAERRYGWWVERFRRALEQVDVLRIDHFRGFEAFWEIPAAEETALNGRWKQGPGQALFAAVAKELGELPLIAEDLGLITEEVEALRDALELPGMRVLQFAFDGNAKNPHLPANHPPRSVAYPGTHDNDTAAGWWQKAKPAERAAANRVLDLAAEPVHWAMLRGVWTSGAAWAVAQLQDVLGLGSEARMNTPSTSEGNWRWRLAAGALPAEAQRRLRELTAASGRIPSTRERSA